MKDTMQALIERLDRIATALEASTLPSVPEGFSDYGEMVYCNVSKGNGDGWYSLDGKQAFTQKPIFYGQVVGINFPTMERNGNEVRKFHLFMRANGQTATFESGYDCFFSKTVLATLAATSPEVLSRPIQLETYIKDLNTGGKTLAVSIRDYAGNKIASSWTNDDDWRSLTALAIENVNTAMGR